MALSRLVLTGVLLLHILSCSIACRRRRSPVCYRRDCTYYSWSSWGSCTASCGYYGVKKRSRSIRSYASCGGSCSYKTTDSTSCPNTCCPIACRYSWQSWSACDATCGYGKRTRRARIISSPRCGGNRCPGYVTETCGNGR